MANLVSEIGHLIAACVPNGLLRIDAVEGAVWFVIKLHVIEDEELSFRPKYCSISDSGGLQVFLGPLSNATRITIVSFACAGFGDGAGQAQRGHRAKRIDERARRVGHGQHVGGFN